MKKGEKFLEVKQVKANADKIKKMIETVKRTAIYVGIPAGTARPDGEITNSELGYIHEYGSPLHNIPARPFLHPSIDEAKADLNEGMREGVEKLFKGDEDGFNKAYEVVALKASSVVKNYITQANFEPLSFATIRGRMRKNPHQDADSMKPLIDTGSLRNSIEGIVVKE